MGSHHTNPCRSIQGVGIEPDIVVEQATVEQIATPSRRRESDLRGALRNEKEDASAKPDAKKETADEEAKPRPRQDYQLVRALDLLNGVALFSRKLAN